jgi:ABC-type transport system substrate-binding protein
LKRIAVALLFILVLLIPIGSWVTSPPSVTSITFRPYGSADDAIHGLMGGDINLLPLDGASPEVLSLLNGSALSVVSIPNFGFTYIGMNLRNPPLNDSNLRMAMLYGFNRQKVLTEVLGGYGEVLNAGLMSSAYAKLGWRNDSANSYEYNPLKAVQLLNSSGYRIGSGNFRIDPATGKQLREMFILSRLSDTADAEAADSFAKDMQSIGLPVYSFPLTNIDFDTQIKRTYVFDMYVDTAPSSPSQKWLYDYFAENNDIAPVPLGSNLVGYQNPQFDACVSRLMSTVNEDTAKEQSKQCQGILSGDLQALPVYSKYSLIVTRLDSSLIVPVTGSLSETIKRTVLRIQQATNRSPINVGVVGTYDNLDPTSTSSPADWTVIDMLTQHLLTFNPDGTLAPELAGSWTISTDAQRITFVLRGNLTYSDGETISPQDFSATLNWLAASVEPSSPLYSTLSEIKNSTTNANMLQITLKQPDSFAANTLGRLFSFPESRLALSIQSSDAFSFLRSNLLVESGPFTLASFDQENGVILRITSGQPSSPQPIEPELKIYSGEGALRQLGLDLFGIAVPTNTPSGRVLNGTFTAYIYRNDSTLATTLYGTYAGHGVYAALFNSRDQIDAGQYVVETQLFGVLPTGMFIVFSHETLVVHSGLPGAMLGTAAAILLGIIAVAITLPTFQLRKPETIRRRRTKWE